MNGVDRLVETENTLATGVQAQGAGAVKPVKEHGSTSSLLAYQPGIAKVIRRNGKVTAFDPNKIQIAMTKAFLAVEGSTAAQSKRIHEQVASLTEQVVHAVNRREQSSGMVHIEDIQDQVELSLMRSGQQKVARAYVLYREKRASERSDKSQNNNVTVAGEVGHIVKIIHRNGVEGELDREYWLKLLQECCACSENVDPNNLLDDALRNLYDGAKEEDLESAMVMSARAKTENEPDYSQVAANLLLHQLRAEVVGHIDGKPTSITHDSMRELYPKYFESCINESVKCGLLDSRLLQFNLERLGQALCPDRDLSFTYMGLKILYDRYFIHSNKVRLELPQTFFMRVAMGLAFNEIDREEKAIDFYNLLSSFDFMSSTPTLFNSGTLRPQLSSCYLTTVPDDLEGIFNAIRDDALLSKFSGGLGNDWSNVRAMGAHIRGTNGESQGVVPFLKVANDTAVAVNQGGKRKGAICAYLEVWHKDIEEFLELRKNTGDDRRRTHDMNSACWIPDLFMKRVLGAVEERHWTLFSPDDTPDLHELYGSQFESRYVEYERMAEAGKIKNFKLIQADGLWRKMLSMLYETGHPWLTFKDPCNLRSPQQHAGVVHSSNLCTEITLNTSIDEIAVCNLGSVNLPQHIDDNGVLDEQKLRHTVRVAMRMLDNVIDINHYSVPQARRSNMRHRPVGLGIMGFQDALYKLDVPYASDAAVDFADSSMERISYYSIEASSDLAAERGIYQSYPGSLWSQGLLPLDSLDLLQKERGVELCVDRKHTMDWDVLRNKIRTQGMRNSNCMAIAPTATISNICGVTQSIEPTYQNLFVKSNLSGEFTVVNPYMVKELKKLELWDEVMINDLKYFDGSIHGIDRIPPEVKDKYATSFEIEPKWIIAAAARRQKWIDQAQSLNLYMATPSGRKLEEMYTTAWKSGLKTTYYLRTLGATHVEKSTMDNTSTNRLNAVASNGNGASNCALNDKEDCEACQ
ncbi:MAG: ribonucleoside-diphosphate reductase subunit alpha [Candidatus Porifericomitaceae bacterium WSBS_2022_MAG_OTU9]